MFYEAWGKLLERADQVLRLEVREHVADPAAQVQLDAVATLLGDLGAIWPHLFEGLATETRLYETAAASGLADPPAPESDPLARHRAAVRALNARIMEARDLEAAERATALTALRAGIGAAAAAQGALMEPAAAQTAGRPGRRI